MWDLELEVHKQRSWFFFRKEIEISCLLNPSIGSALEFNLPKFIATFLEYFDLKVISYFTFSSKAQEEGIVLKNLRGRTRVSEEALSSREEIVFLKGRFFKSLESEDLEKEEKEFSLNLYSTFDRFDGISDIIYRVLSSESGDLYELAEELSLLTFDKLQNRTELYLNEFRFGLEHFQSHFISSMIGTAPSVSEKFYIEARDKQVVIRSIFFETKDGLVPEFSSKLLNAVDYSLKQTQLCSILKIEIEKNKYNLR